MDLLMEIDDIQLFATETELVLQRPWENGREYLLDHGAEKIGKPARLAKRFPRSRFLATQAEIERRLTIFHENTDFVSGMSGYSELNQQRCAELGIRVGEYESAVVGLMQSAINRVRKRMSRARYGLVYGAADMGVDHSIEVVAKKENLPLIGFNCLDYLWYVDNAVEGPFICVYRTKDEYCHAYVDACDLLMASNGGQVSYQKDIIAATQRMIPVLPIDVIGMLGASIPAFKPDGKTVNDAVGALLHVMRLIGFQERGGLAEDRYTQVADAFASAVVARAREVIPPAYAYEALES